MAKEVTDYRVKWSTNQDDGHIEVRLGTNNKFTKVPLTSQAEFAALLALLQGPKTVQLDTKSRVFSVS